MSVNLGEKQTCPDCRARFYDLGRRPAVCPKCGNSFFPQNVRSSGRVRAGSRSASGVVSSNQSAEVDSDEAEEAENPDLMVQEAVLVGGGLEDDGEDEASAPGFDQSALEDSDIDDGVDEEGSDLSDDPVEVIDQGDDDSTAE